MKFLVATTSIVMRPGSTTLRLDQVIRHVRDEEWSLGCSSQQLALTGPPDGLSGAKVGDRFIVEFVPVDVPIESRFAQEEE